MPAAILPMFDFKPIILKKQPDIFLQGQTSSKIIKKVFWVWGGLVAI